MLHIKFKRGLTITETLAILVCLTVMIAVTLPVLGRVGSTSGTTTSLNNLITLGVAHTMYAADWNGAQISIAPYDLGAFGSVSGWNDAHGIVAGNQNNWGPMLGWDSSASLLWYRMSWPGNHGLSQAINFSGNIIGGFGWFRIPNSKQFFQYVNGRFYDPVFYPPNDSVVYPLVEPLFGDPWEYPSVDLFVPKFGDSVYWSSYSLSPAALFSPKVMRAEPDGGFQHPFTLADGFATPGLFQARYPDLKTMFIEHHWNQGAPLDPCNPNAPFKFYNDCEPYYFNQAIASTPATLFYDLSTRLLPNTEVFAADAQLINQTGFGLWSRDTPFGPDGYGGANGFDKIQLSHHILTTDGILGRDTLSGVSAATIQEFNTSASTIQNHRKKHPPIQRKEVQIDARYR